jgi:hypothetical protein
MLLGVHAGGGLLSTASRDNEREAFLNAFLMDVLPPQFRFGTGDAIDQAGRISGQLDIVIEYPFVPSLPLVAGRSPRLYLAEGIVAVVEVKSNVEKQWADVVRTATQLTTLIRNYGTGVSVGPRAGKKIPLYAVGYEGWKQHSTLRKRLAEAPAVSGILVIQEGHFTGAYDYLDAKQRAQTYRCETVGSPMALWSLVTCIHHAGSMITSTTKDVPHQYG